MKNGIVYVLGALLLAIGAVWGLQGVGVLTGSPMTGQKLWFGIGLLAVIAGAGLIAYGVRRTRADKAK
ncbi:hypothetical protein CFN78_26775 [Amycolatopsis antarctica]|uniref:Uncharacterized protein n=1 Tax=Amycolatopsis antarctica TaxID=1854586 RepID=A0A263CVM0_9PSEU|nr:hypothetical protein [Amycolatopsis antarctica]OZM70174.1 hypothetical protein CFN78_26775 [Amycolatopsis antarctica]